MLIIFWILDTYYLRLERLYRFLYQDVVDNFNNSSKENEIKLFDMNYERFKEKAQSFLRIMFSKTEGLFYLALIVAMIGLLVLSLFP